MQMASTSTLPVLYYPWFFSTAEWVFLMINPEEEKIIDMFKSHSNNNDVGTGRKFVPPRHRQEWKSYNASSPSNNPLKTTVMIKNIPNQFRRDIMLKFLDSYCNAYSLEYDFLYLPMDFITNDNLGYAFVNFTTAGAARKFKEILQNYRWETVQTETGLFTSKKICEITWARIQGKEGVVKWFQKSKFACDKLDYLPVVFDPPRNGSDPEPTPPLILGRLAAFNKIH